MNKIYTYGNETLTEKPNEGNKKLTDTVKKVADFDFSISKDVVIKQLPFIMYCCVLLLVFIFITHQTEKTARNTEILKNETKNLRTYYINTLSMLMYESKQSNLARKLSKKGIKELKTPPYKITYNDGN